VDRADGLNHSRDGMALSVIFATTRPQVVGHILLVTSAQRGNFRKIGGEMPSIEQAEIEILREALTLAEAQIADLKKDAVELANHALFMGDFFIMGQIARRILEATKEQP
jgi:hypothetical protein